MTQITLERLLNEFRNADVVVRNMEIAIERFERSDLKLEDKVKALFTQGHSIGVHIYKGAHYNHSKLISKLDELEVTPSTTQIIVGNLRKDSPVEDENTKQLGGDVSDMTHLEGYRLHPKAARVMASIMLISLFLTLFGKLYDCSDLMLALTLFPALFSVCAFVAQDMRIWKNQNE